MTEVIKTVATPVFVKRVHELASLLKLVEKGSKDAVDLLVDTMNAKDEDVGRKMRVQCAEALVTLQIKIADTISKDQLTRQIAEIKIKGLTHGGETEEGKAKAPRVDFMTIQEV